MFLSADPPEYNKLYAIPGGVLLGSYGYAASTNLFPDIHQATYLAASMCCVGALTGLSSQTTSRIGRAGSKAFHSLLALVSCTVLHGQYHHMILICVALHMRIICCEVACVDKCNV